MNIYITDMSEDMGYDEFDVFMINCKDVKVYIPANFKMNKYGGCRKDAGGKFAMGYDERCTGCKTYVKKNSKLAKKLDKNGDKYNVY